MRTGNAGGRAGCRDRRARRLWLVRLKPVSAFKPPPLPTVGPEIWNEIPMSLFPFRFLATRHTFTYQLSLFNGRLYVAVV